ncbi:MAG: thioredoxin family protein [Burkholderiales bacterium]|nr:thioredoxin family protein [Burkholderiales bacterium]
MTALATHATGMPAPYQAMVVPPVLSDKLAPGGWEFDLRPALQRARKEGRSLYVYLSASDCPYCRKYEAFLTENAKALVPHFREKYIVVDLRAELSVQAKQLVLRTDQHHLPYTEFQRAIGDQRARMLVYPSVWLLDGNAKPLMQMPAGAGTFMTVPEQLEILNLVE